MTERRRLAIVAVCLAAVLPYLSTLNNYFIADDFGVVALLTGKPLSYFPRWFVSSWMDRIWGTVNDEIRPFPALSYQLLAVFGAAVPAPNHVMNIALHAANGLLVFAIAEGAAFLGLAGATFAGLVFVLLPFQAESTAWITGRVDSLPTCLYLASFLAYTRWRAGGSTSAARYTASLLLFFVALFSKQNVITLPAALVLYDVLASSGSSRKPQESLSVASAFSRKILASLPFWAMTLGYLALRFAIFGEVARESQLTAGGIQWSLGLIARHAERQVFGQLGAASPLGWLAAGLAAAAAVWVWLRVRNAEGVPRAGMLLFFGPVWWGLGVAPLIVVAYESPRHIHLASAGWAVMLGAALQIALQIGLRARAGKAWRAGVAVAAALLLGTYTVKLAVEVGRWNTKAVVSKQAVEDLQREANAVPEGTLVLVGVPPSVWGWSLPFAARPPYTSTDLTRRVLLVSPWQLTCCPDQWHGETVATVRRWLARPESGALALHWDPATGYLSRLTDRENPDLRTALSILQDMPTAETLDRNLLAILDQLVARPAPKP